ncbi:MAG: DUF6273 domain-containing protein [Oscillospiraceae bacterium]|nr:DUF6273 domain-containing protein [Oscillospiraceae bacterium]
MDGVTEHITWRNRIFPFLGAAFVFVLCFCVLYFGENVGLSDNGDFRRILLANNMEYKDDTDYYYLFKQDYVMEVEGDTFTEMLKSVCQTSPDVEEIYTSPHFVLIKVSKVMNFLANCITGNDVTDYNIAWLAGIYITMLSVAAWCVFTFFQGWRKLMQLAVFALFIFIFCDAGYLLYFNSFYGEPLQYVAVMLLIAVGLMIYRRASIPKAVCFYIALYFFAGSKLVNIPYAIIVGVLALCMTALRKDKLYRIGVAVSAAISICFIINLYTDIPDWMQKDTTYQSVFFGLAKESDTPAEDLEELGVNEKYISLVNTHAYMDEGEYLIDIETSEFERDFYDKVSKSDILFFYLRHPARLFKKLCLSIESSAYIRPPNVGNSSEQIMEMTNRFSLWSNIRIFLKFLYQPIVIFAVIALITIYVIIINIYTILRRGEDIRRRIYMICACDVLLIGLWINLILPIVCNGEADLAKHMFLFINYIDILFAVLIIGMFNMTRENVIISSVIVASLTAVFYISPPKETVEFGTYNGKSLKWEIVEVLNDNSLILITKDKLDERRFDGSNNMWETSELRTWLNTDFLLEFTDEERSRIMPVTNEVLLAYNDKGLSVAGNHTHYWNFMRNMVSDLSKTAYHYYLEDYVYIPTLDMLSKLNPGNSYWVLCPYAGNDKMERYMKYDGFILHTNVDNVKGVRAVIKYDNSTVNLLE